jgi:hypothetical protein
VGLKVGLNVLRETNFWDMNVYHQSEFIALNTMHSFIFYNMFRPSSGRNCYNTNGQVY